ncbi:MAG: hypothetical protein V4684_15700 [Pseudomonadota bacterium]
MAKVLATIADPDTEWEQDHCAIGFQTPPHDDIDRELITTITKQVRAMTLADLDALKAGLDHVDCYQLSIPRNLPEPDRLKLERGQQTSLLISDVVHGELASKRVSGMRKAQAEGLAQQARGPLTRPKGVQEPSHPKQKSTRGAKPDDAAKHDAKPNRETNVFRSKAQMAAKAQAMRTRVQANVNASLGFMTRPLGMTKARDAIEMTKVQKFKRWVSLANHKTDPITGNVLSRYPDRAKPSQNQVNVALDALFAAVPTPNPGSRAKSVFFWESKPTLDQDDAYKNAFRGHIGRTLLRMDTPHLVEILHNMLSASDQHKADFRFGMLSQAIDDQLMHRGYHIAEQASDLVADVLNTLMAPAARSSAVAVGDLCSDLLLNLDSLARTGKLPDPAYYALVHNAFARQAENPQARTAIAALLEQVPADIFFAITDANKPRPVTSQGHRWIAALAETRRQAIQGVSSKQDKVKALGEAIDAASAALSSGARQDPAAIVDALSNVGRLYRELPGAGISLDPGRIGKRVPEQLAKLRDAVQTMDVAVFNEMQPADLSAALGVFSIPGLDASPGVTEIINRRLKIGPFMEAAGSLTRSLSQAALQADPMGFIRPLLRTHQRHTEMRAMGVQLSQQRDHDSVAPRANQALKSARIAIANIPVAAYEAIKNRGDLRAIQAALQDLEIDPGPQVNAAIAERLAPPGRLALRAEAVIRLRDRFPLPGEGLDDHLATVPFPQASRVLAETDKFLARVSRIAASAGSGVSSRAGLQFEGLRESIGDDTQGGVEEAAALLVDGLATRTQTLAGQAQIKTLLQILPPAQLEQLGTAQPSGRIPLAIHAEFIALVNDAWEARAIAASQRFDTAVANWLAGEPAQHLESLSALIAARGDLRAWDVAPQTYSLDLLSARLANRVDLIAQLDAKDIASLKSMSLGIDRQIRQASARRANDLTARHSKLWLGGLESLRAGALEAGTRVLRQAMVLAGEIDRCHHLVAGTPLTQDSGRVFHEVLMQNFVAELSTAQKADFAALVVRSDVRELMSVLELPYTAASGGVTQDEASLRRALFDNLKLFAPEGTQYRPVRPSAEVMAAVAQAFVSELRESGAPVAQIPAVAREVAAKESSAVSALRAASGRAWSDAMILLGKGDLHEGLAKLKLAVSMGEEVEQVQAQEKQGQDVTVSPAHQQAVVTQMKLDETQLKQFALTLNNPEVRELIVALRYVSSYAPDSANRALPLIRRVAMDLELLRDRLSIPPFETVTVSVDMREVVISGFRAELGLRGERLVKEALETHSPIRPTRSARV